MGDKGFEDKEKNSISFFSAFINKLNRIFNKRSIFQTASLERKAVQIEQSPLFRKKISHWYESRIVCVFLIICMDAVFIFSVSGVAAARDITEYQRYIWLPILLMLLSGVVMFSISLRIIREFIREHFKKE